MSARYWNGNELEVLRRCRSGAILSITSPGILSELANVLLDKFLEPMEEVNTYIGEVALLSQIVFPNGDVRAVVDDPADNMVLETALLGEVDLIVTGDKHLLSLGCYEGIRIIQARRLLQFSSR